MTLFGIDLGTTNSALATVQGRGPVRIVDVPQLVAAGEVAALPTLPSFLYFSTEGERAAAAVSLPWDPSPDVVVGTFAREQGALVPARQVTSAKSWLSNAAVDRTAALLPWGVEDGRRMSPVEASMRVLAHFRDAWNHTHARDDADRMERQPIVLTVPASFDEEARELTVAAARDAGFEHLTLLEEPLAALYAWIATHRQRLAETLADGALVLVCDVGGGTTDFSLIRATAEEGEIQFERIAIGEHLLLGGDNLDLALAVQLERRLTGGEDRRLTLTQRQALRRSCSAAKERLLSEPGLDRVRITILGAGRGVVGGNLTTELTREEVEAALADGFLPLTRADDLPSRDRRPGLRELGLPFETEPAITRHLAAFLTRAGGGTMVRPDAILFNGGFFTPRLAKDRVLAAIEGWTGTQPAVLENERPEAAVAQGAAFYARLRQDPEASRRLLIRAGSARAYYVRVAGADQADALTAVCVLPRGTQEGTTLPIDRPFTVTTNAPAEFTLLSSTDRDDPVNALVTFESAAEPHRHAPLVTALRFGKRSRRVPLEVRLSSVFTETGTLELWCDSTTTEHRWRLAFNLRGTERDPFADEEAGDGEDQVVLTENALDAAVARVRATFGDGANGDPATLAGDLENLLGHGKHAWPLPAIRRLADVLLELAAGRGRSAAHEARWLNLVGFCARPGFGSPADEWRISELRKVYASGLMFPKETQNQVEWLVLWQRVGAGFNGGQQRELAQRVMGQLGIGQKKPPRVNPQIEREGWRLLGSLEKLDAGHKTKLGDELLPRIRREPRNTARLWTLGRLGARTPLYGPLNTVVAPAVAERWIDALLALKELNAEATAALVQLGARAGDDARDVSAETRARVLARLAEEGVPEEATLPLREVVPMNRGAATRAFGESLPQGLRLGGGTVPNPEPHARMNRGIPNP